MLDNRVNQLLRPLMQQLARSIRRTGVQPDHFTLLGFGFGIAAIVAIALHSYPVGLLLFVFNRICDGLDGALARETQPSDAGGYLDIVLDFMIYAGLVVGFVISQPEANAIPGSLLLATFMGTGSSFLAFAIMAERHQINDDAPVNKSLHYLQGLTEGTETILFFILCLLFPVAFPIFAYVFALLCTITTITRLIYGYRVLRKLAN